MKENFDPFLNSCKAHKKYPIFELLTFEYPISIRDQMIRACLIIERALKLNLIGINKHLLIVGAGAAGVTAALKAIENNVPTILVEKEPIAFKLQTNCNIRYIDPVQYDWPLLHWDEGKFSWKPPSVPLNFKADFSNNISWNWNKILANIVSSKNKLFKLHLSSSVVWYKKNSNVSNLVFSIEGPNPVLKQDISMAILSTGFREENSTINQFTGYKFWQDDPFGVPNFNKPSSFKPEILIVGSGDGALQDFIRITTRSNRPVKELYLKIKQYIPPEILTYIQTAEDQTQRAYIWNNKKHQDHYILEKLHNEYKFYIKQIISDSKTWNKIRFLLKPFLKPLLKIKLIQSCSHFSRCYALNHFMVLLINEYYSFESKGRKTPIYENLGVEIIYSNTNYHYYCANDPDECHGKVHKVRLIPRLCYGVQAVKKYSSYMTYQQEDANIIVIRTGVIKTSGEKNTNSIMDDWYETEKSDSIDFVRQLLPYHL